jgi:hypothetical protein
MLSGAFGVNSALASFQMSRSVLLRSAHFCARFLLTTSCAYRGSIRLFTVALTSVALLITLFCFNTSPAAIITRRWFSPIVEFVRSVRSRTLRDDRIVKFGVAGKQFAKFLRVLEGPETSLLIGRQDALDIRGMLLGKLFAHVEHAVTVEVHIPIE